MELFINGKRVAQIDSGPSQDGLLASLTWLTNHARDRGKPLRRGDAILTGARLRSVVVERNTEICAKVQGLGDVELSMCTGTGTGTGTGAGSPHRCGPESCRPVPPAK